MISIITYIGAINIIEKKYNIENYYGSTLSSVLCLLLVLEYTSDEILKIFKDIKWNEVINIKNYDITNLINDYCIYDGTTIEDLIKQYIKHKNYDENITLLELVREVNLLQSQNLKLLQDIRDATNFADLKIRIDQK